MSPSLKKLEEGLAEYYGWAITPDARSNLSAAVVCKAGRLGICQDEYCEIAATSQSEMLALVEQAAVGETGFFRESDQFEFLKTVIVPGLDTPSAKCDPVRVWSSACSTGEEPYSLAIAFQQSVSQGKERSVEIFATDVRNGALLVASQARYESPGLSGIESSVRNRYFVPCPNSKDERGATQFSLVPEVRRLVTFRRVNLLEQIFWRSLAGRFDLIVCTNLLVLLHSVAIRRMVGRLAHSLKLGGFLMVAPTEAVFVNHPHLRALENAPAFFSRVE